ncbi:MmgE/PrpD family protein [Salinibacterium sp. TMP30]|uniref:MmgE/PrpD family protein n=1 Tax=Salinibacterium sp. TMP30 TaxID=3138237 RepID=UPI0031398EAD
MKFDEESSSNFEPSVQELARFVAATTGDHIPSATRRRASFVISDTIGVMLRGSVTDLAHRLIDGSQNTGPATVISPLFQRVDIEEATLLNAVSACSTELDEGTRPTGHPAMHILPPVLATTQANDASGRRFLTAFILGYEVQARIQRAARLRPPIHCHGNYGHVGVAAALAWLRGADAIATAAAMNAAAAFASATSYSLPYSGATIHSAAPAMSGLTALTVDRLMAVGFSAFDRSVTEVFGSILGERFEEGPLTENLGASWAVNDGYVKFHSTCGHLHPVVDALIDAVREDTSPERARWELGARIDPRTVARVSVRVSERAAELDALPELLTPLAARFSIPFSVATTLVHGAASAAAFEGAALTDPDIRQLAERVTIQSDSKYDAVFPDVHRARVELEFTSGRVLTGSCENPYGNPKNRALDEDIGAKFIALVSEAAPELDAIALWATTLACDDRISMRGFPLLEDG